MEPALIPLPDFRLPHHPNAPLNLNNLPLSIISTENFSDQSTTTNLSVPIGLATILYNWCPDALAAFLDLDAWFSLTWNLSLAGGTADETQLEIGRVGNQITFGTLNAKGEKWLLMLTYNIAMEESSSSNHQRGAWIPNGKESMHGDDDVTAAAEIERLGREWVAQMLVQKRWQTGKKMRHRFFVEYAPMDDVWGDGIAMNPHWLYKSLCLDECTTCTAKNVALQRCGRCGTATYCSGACQRRDWAVHKAICGMSLVDRGQALRVSEKGGLIMWDQDKTFAEEGSGEVARNPNFREPQLRRVRVKRGSVDGEMNRG